MAISEFEKSMVELMLKPKKETFLYDMHDIKKHIDNADKLVRELKYPADVHVALAQVKLDWNRLIMEAERDTRERYK